ncbi:hypothetical protein, partial [Streptococcus pneumoniae]|uniref:hypothetical protein n=2 Tax=Streptococcus pneumoniae TaxID=1313 RepID=UPI001CD8548D
RTIPNSTNYIFKERRKGSQLFSVNFIKNLNNFDGVLFFCLEINIRVNFGMFTRFCTTCKRILSFSKIEQD